MSPSFMHERLWEALLGMLVMGGASAHFALQGEVSGREALAGGTEGFSIALVSLIGASAIAGATHACVSS